MQHSCPVALVTGSTSGIGSASRVGCSAETGRALAGELGTAAYVRADLAHDADRVRLVREAVALWGRLDVLINKPSPSLWLWLWLCGHGALRPSSLR